jgi:hypothetical protein
VPPLWFLPTPPVSVVPLGQAIAEAEATLKAEINTSESSFFINMTFENK